MTLCTCIFVVVCDWSCDGLTSLLAQLKIMFTISYNVFLCLKKSMHTTNQSYETKPNVTKLEETLKTNERNKRLSLEWERERAVCVCVYIYVRNKYETGWVTHRVFFYIVCTKCMFHYISCIRTNIKRLPNVHCSDVILQYIFFVRSLEHSCCCCCFLFHYFNESWLCLYALKWYLSTGHINNSN